MKNHMKKYVRFIILSAFLLAALLPRTAMADAKPSGSGILKLSESECAVTVSLSIPEGATENITTVHTHVYVDLQNGSFENAPSFKLSQALEEKSVVANTDVLQKTDNDYVLDIILSGIEDLFPDENAVELGTLYLNPDVSESEFQAEVGFDSVEHRDEDASTEPSIEYIEGDSDTPVTVPLAYTDKLIVTEEAGSPVDETQAFDAPSMTVKLGGKYQKLLTFRWKRAESADGYQIYQYDAASQKYKRFKTFKDGSRTVYQKSFSYATDYRFKLRAFTVSENGDRTYGEFGKIVKITTAPASPTDFRAVYADDTGANIALSWKAVEGATGYRIYRSDTVDGKYTFLKTVKGKTAATDTQTAGTYHYYKIRAFRKDEAKKRVFGLYANRKAIWLKATVATAKSANRSKKVTVSWTKLPLADGYAVYQYDKEKKAYVLAAEVDGANTLKATLALKFNSTYKFIVRGRQIQNGLKVFGMASAAVKADTAPGQVRIKSLSSTEPGIVTVKWNKVSTADGYHIWRSTSKDGVYSPVGSVAGRENLQLTDFNVQSGVTYYYTVRAFRNSIQGDTLLGIFSPRISVKVR